MKNSKFTESQIVAILKETDRDQGGGSLPQARHQAAHLLQREEQVWGLSVSDLKRTRGLEAELSELKLKRTYADLAMENDDYWNNLLCQAG